MLDAANTLDCHIREPDPQFVSCALRVRNVPQAISEDVLLELFNQGGHVEHFEAFEVPPGSLGPSQAQRITCKVRYCSVASSLSAFAMFYHTLVLRGQPLMVDFWQPETSTERVTVPAFCTRVVLELVQKFNSHCDLPAPRGFKGFRLRHLVPVAPPPHAPGVGLSLQLTEDPVLRKLADEALAAGQVGVDPFLPALAVHPALSQGSLLPLAPPAEAAWHQAWLGKHPARKPTPRPASNKRAGLYAPSNQEASAALHGALSGALAPRPALGPWQPQHVPQFVHVVPAGVAGAPPLPQAVSVHGGPVMIPAQQLAYPVVPMSAAAGWPASAPLASSVLVSHAPAAGAFPGPPPLPPHSPSAPAPAPTQGPPGGSVPGSSAPQQPMRMEQPTGGPPSTHVPVHAAPGGAVVAEAQHAQHEHHAQLPATGASPPQCPLEGGGGLMDRMPSVSDALAAARSLCSELHLEDPGSGRGAAPASPGPAAGLAGAPAAGGPASAAAPTSDADEILGYIPLENGQMMAVRRSALLPAAPAAAAAGGPPAQPGLARPGGDVDARPEAAAEAAQSQQRGGGGEQVPMREARGSGADKVESGGDVGGPQAHSAEGPSTQQPQHAQQPEQPKAAHPVLLALRATAAAGAAAPSTASAPPAADHGAAHACAAPMPGASGADEDRPAAVPAGAAGGLESQHAAQLAGRVPGEVGARGIGGDAVQEQGLAPPADQMPTRPSNGVPGGDGHAAGHPDAQHAHPMHATQALPHGLDQTAGPPAGGGPHATPHQHDCGTNDGANPVPAKPMTAGEPHMHGHAMHAHPMDASQQAAAQHAGQPPLPAEPVHAMHGTVMNAIPHTVPRPQGSMMPLQPQPVGVAASSAQPQHSAQMQGGYVPMHMVTMHAPGALQQSWVGATSAAPGPGFGQSLPADGMHAHPSLQQPPLPSENSAPNPVRPARRMGQAKNGGRVATSSAPALQGGCAEEALVAAQQPQGAVHVSDAAVAFSSSNAFNSSMGMQGVNGGNGPYVAPQSGHVNAPQPQFPPQPQEAAAWQAMNGGGWGAADGAQAPMHVMMGAQGHPHVNAQHGGQVVDGVGYGQVDGVAPPPPLPAHTPPLPPEAPPGYGDAAVHGGEGPGVA